MTTATARKQGLSSQIRDCLAHLHDVPYLQQHPLAGVVAQQSPAAIRSQGHALQDWLRAATEGLRPDVPAAANDRLWRPYHVVRLRYVDALDVAAVCERLGVSQAEFYRELTRAIGALTAVFQAEHPALRGGDAAAEVGAAAGAAPYLPQVSLRLRATQGSAPLVGRRDELEFLLARLDDVAQRGAGGLVLLTGDAGVGKTRLLREFERLAREHGCGVAFGRYLRDDLSPYHGWSEALYPHMQAIVSKGLPPELLHYHAELAQLFPDLLTESETPGAAAGTRGGEASALFDCVVDLLRRLAAQRPLLLVIEDVQWAGGMRLLSHVARRLHDLPLLVVCTARDSDFQDNPAALQQWAELDRARLGIPLRLSGLNEAETAAVLTHFFGAAAAEEIAPAVFERTRGNPFFIEEVARALVESGSVTWDGERWAVDEIARIRIPTSVRLTIKERIDRLGEPYGEVLGWAAVLGQRFSMQVLASAMDRTEDDLLPLVERLLEAHILEYEAAVGEDYLTFVDEHVQEVLYESIAGPRRRRYHLRALQVIEDLFRHRPDQHLEDLARHSVEGNLVAQGAEYCYQAGRKADRLCAWDRAVRWYEQALSLWEQLGGHLEQRAEVSARLGRTLYESMSNPAKGADYLAIALADYQTLGNVARTADLHSELGRAYMLSGDLRMLDLNRALHHLHLSHDTLAPLGPSLELGRACFSLAQAHARVMRIPEAIEWAHRSFDLGQQVHSPELSTQSQIVLGGLLWGAGQLEAGRGMLEDAWRSAVAHDLGPEADYCRYAGARSCVALKAPHAGLAWVERRPDHRTRWSLVDIQSHLVGIRTLLCDFAGAHEAFATMSRRLETSGQPSFGHFPSNPGLLLARTGDWAAAERLLLAGLQWAHERQYILSELHAAVTLAELCADQGRTAEAETRLAWAALEARKAGSVTALARAVPRLAELYVAQGRCTEARTLLDEVRDVDFGWSAGVQCDLALADALLTLAEAGPEAATPRFEQAAGRLHSAGLAWDAARAHLTWGVALRGAGQPAASTPHLAQAAAAWTALGVPAYVRLAEAAAL